MTGSYVTSRSALEKWPDSSSWNTERLKEEKMRTKFTSIPFICTDPQRDIHKDLSEKNSWVGRILACIEYNDDDILALESLIEEVNIQAVDKSNELTKLKSNLEKLNRSFDSSGKAEITPIPKKVRDFPKHFSIHFGETDNRTFPMEYHGMGTRSWASMLAISAFIDLMFPKHEQEARMFFPILAVEEPEAHLHPNAQKTLYRQLEDFRGQVIVSTHSPYLVAMANQSNLRYLKKEAEGVVARYLSAELEEENQRKLQREVVHSRGEIFFSKALVLCEGETEEQALPLLFEKYFGNESFVLGVSFIGVGGSGKYLPFLTFARDFSIPVFIFSDGEEQTVKKVIKDYTKLYGDIDIAQCKNIVFLDETDFEDYLLFNGFKSIIESAIQEIYEDEHYIQKWIDRKQGQTYPSKRTNLPPCKECNQPIYISDTRNYDSVDGYAKALSEILHEGKTKFAPVIAEKLCELEIDQLPRKIIELFESIKSESEI